MKRHLYALFVIVLSSVLASCSRDEADAERVLEVEPEYITITAVREGYNGEEQETKTVRQEDGAVYWNAKDKISLFYGTGTNGGSRFTCTSEETAQIVEFTGIDPALGTSSEGRYWAVYPYSKDNTCEGNCVVMTIPDVQTALDGSFANNLFPTVGTSSDKTVTFYNVCGGVKFSVSQAGIKTVTFKGNGGESLAGKVKVGFGANGRPEVTSCVETRDEVTLLAPNGGTFEVGRYYYVVLLPASLDKGFTMTFTTKDGKEGTYAHSSGVAVKRSVFGVLDEIDGYVKAWKNAPLVSGGWDRGSIYLGLMGFNDDIYRYNLSKLTDDTAAGYYSFIDNLQAGGATVLYYSVEQALEVLKSAMYPEDIQNISIITFTDGMDEGSIMMTDKYLYEDEYLNAISNTVASERIAGLDLSSYTVALTGNVHSSNLSYFRNMLKKIASSSENATDFSDMDEVSEKFKELANLISSTNYVQTIPLQVNGKSQGTKMRFTLDGASKATSSQIYIEGVFNIDGEYVDGVFHRTGYSLREITYQGLTSTSGNAVVGVKSGVKVVYTFEGLRRQDAKLINTDDIALWTYIPSTGSWQNTNETVLLDGENGIVNEKQSTAIMLVLDCSNSLTVYNDFGKMQKAAKEFVSILCENSIDENAVASVSLDRYAADIPVGSKLALNATVLPATALHRDVIWSSNNTAVASVDASGIVTAHSKGSAYIYVITEDGAKTAVCLVTVPQYAESLEIDKSTAVLYTGESLELNVTVSPDDTSDKTLQWSSSNPSVATVDQNGKITALKAGSVKITASTVDGSGLKVTCDLTVKQHVTGVSLNESSVILNKGDSKSLVATVLPSDATDKRVIWRSTDESVATVDEYGVVSGVGKGSATITVTTEDGGKTDMCEVEVRQFVTSIQLDKQSVTLSVSESVQLVATVSPDDADDASVKWTSSNPAVASVDQTGMVSALAPGTSTISVAAQDGSGKVATSVITVRQPLTGIGLSHTSLDLIIGNSQTITVTFTPSDASNTDYAVENTNPSIATVTKNGKSISVKSKGLGTTTIKVTSAEGGFTAECNVSVSLSKTPSNLALVVKKNNVRYYIPQSIYSQVTMPLYTKEGIAVISGTESFILALSDASTSTYTYADAKSKFNLPTLAQGEVISQYWSSINSALSTYGGTPMVGGGYWTQTAQGTRSAWYYHSSGTSNAFMQRTYYVRNVVADL